METLSRRAVIVALSALPLVACEVKSEVEGFSSIGSGLDMDAMREVAQTYQDATGDPVGPGTQSALFSAGKANLDYIQKTVQSDFADGRMFIHNGWRLSHTEGQLFTLLAKT